ncbi:hypothetical protein PAMA_007339 [Pampus argenteus]
MILGRKCSLSTEQQSVSRITTLLAAYRAPSAARVSQKEPQDRHISAYRSWKLSTAAMLHDDVATSEMSELSAEDEAELQSLLRQLLRSLNDRISGAPSTECAEEILLHLEETDKNFHNYEFVKYLRQYVESSLGTVVEEETKNLSRGDGQHAIGSGHDTLIHGVTRRTRESAEYQQMMQTLKNSMIMVVESLINKFEEDQLKKEEMHREKQHSQSNSQYDNCSDSDSSFNQSYAFIRQDQLQALAEKLDSSRPKEVRWAALQALCGAPPSDVLSCESWSSLRRNLCAALSEPDHDLSDNVLQFFAKSFSSSPLNVTREIYTSLAKSVESTFLSHKLSFPTGSAAIDINRPEISRPLKQIRLMNDFQKEVTTFWIRHPEKYMEDVIESTFSLLSFHHEHGSALEPIHFLALLDIKATWFKKWMHGFYSRTVVLRLLERKYKSLTVAALQQCIHYSESCEHFTNETTDVQSAEQQNTGSIQRSVYTGKELEYAFFVHSLCVLGKLLTYTNGRKLFPIKVRNHKDPVSLTDLVVTLINIMYQHPAPLHIDASHMDSLSPSSLVMEVLWMLCERTECAAECLHHTAVIETLLAPVIALLHGQQTKLKCPAVTLTLIADVLARIANSDRGLALFLYEKNLVMAHSERTSAAHVIVQFTLKLLDKDLSSLSDSDVSHTLCGAFIFVCRQIYNTYQFLVRKGSNPGTWNKCWNIHSEPTEHVSRCEKFGYGVMVTQVAATAPGVAALHSSGFVRALVLELWSALECSSEDVRVVRPKPTPMDPIDRSCHKCFLSLVNLLSSHSVWELLGRQPLANKSQYSLREMPTSIPLHFTPQDLIDRLIAVDADVKIRSLFHYEQSHTFGLRLLSVLCCNLDSFLLLESQYNICSMLLRSQRENVSEQGYSMNSSIHQSIHQYMAVSVQLVLFISYLHREFIIDSLSVERNHVLVRVSSVGGPSERRLPPRALQEGEDPYPWPMFSCYPLPPCYTLDPSKIHHNSPDPEFSTFLASCKDTKNEESWMEICRRHYCRALATKSNVLTGKSKTLGAGATMDSPTTNVLQSF